MRAGPPAGAEHPVEDVIDGDRAEEPAGLVGDGDGQQVVAGEDLGDVAVGGVRGHRRVVGDQAPELHVRWLAEQALHVDDADELAGRCLVRRLGDEDLRGDADHPVGVADLCERLGDRCVGAEDDHLGCHQATGGALLVGQQAPDDVGVVDVHHAEHPFLVGRRHLAEEVGEVVVLHLVEHADETVAVELLDDADLLFLGQLLEHVGEAFVVHGLGELASLVDREGSHDGGHLGGVELAQSGRFGLHGGLSVEQRRDLVEVDQPIARTATQRALAGEANLVDHPVGGACVLLGPQARCR